MSPLPLTVDRRRPRLREAASDPSVFVNIGMRAQRQAERIDEQRREAADSRHLFAADFAEVLEDLATIEWPGQP